MTLYDVNGHYYRNSVTGSRAVVVYSYGDEYFLPPTDREWVGRDNRYNYNRQPSAETRAACGRMRRSHGSIAVSARKSACWATRPSEPVTG